MVRHSASWDKYHHFRHCSRSYYIFEEGDAIGSQTGDTDYTYVERHSPGPVRFPDVGSITTSVPKMGSKNGQEKNAGSQGDRDRTVQG